MAIVRPGNTGELPLVEVDELDDVDVLDDVVEDVAELVVGGVVAAGAGDPLEHPARVSAAAATTALMVRRRIPPSSFRSLSCPWTLGGVAIVGRARSATMCGCPTG
ncbi:MAG TPA: hypothetical protein VNC14_06740 [Lapillicoccus sp.]|jgi:hypothetical protein|nr:hypothetical protein [Lapillicoccus sp.]